MPQTRDLYEVLGVSPDASQEEIKRAYRALARRHHPDVSGDPEAEHRFKEINLAYQTLSDPAKRRQYDLTGGEGFTPDMFSFLGDFNDIFEAFFGSPFGRGSRQRARDRSGGDLHAVLDLTFEEAASGVQREVPVERLVRCERCEGNGSEPGTAPSRCTTCGGSGQVSDVRRSVFGTVMTSRTCATCGGTGEEIASPCKDCGGRGRRAFADTVTVEVPAGVDDGMDLRVEGAGHQGTRGAAPGDLYIALRVAPHPVYRRRGQDLVAVLEVPMTQAALGVDLEIETLDGTEKVRIAPGTGSGTIIRVAGGGVPNVGRRGRGDLYLQIDVPVPEPDSKKEREVLEELADLRDERPAKKPLPGRLRPPE